MAAIKVTASLDQLDAVTEFVDGELEKSGCPLKTQMQFNIIVDELFSNIARYAYTGLSGEDKDVEISLSREPDSDVLLLVFEDKGIPFDPLKEKEPDVTLSAEERKIGGLGIFLVRKLTDRMDYEYRDGKNILRVWKKVQPGTSGEKE